MSDRVYGMGMVILLIGLVAFIVVADERNHQAQKGGSVTLRDTYTDSFVRYRCDELRIKEVSGAPTVFCTQGKYEHVFYGLVPWRVDRER